jgi:hypothetical protein
MKMGRTTVSEMTISYVKNEQNDNKLKDTVRMTLKLMTVGRTTCFRMALDSKTSCKMMIVRMPLN